MKRTFKDNKIPTWSINPFTEMGATSRPYFIPFPKDWQARYSGLGRAAMVESIESSCSEVSSHYGPIFAKYRRTKPKRTTFNTNQGIVFGPKPEIVEKEIDEDAISAILEE